MQLQRIVRLLFSLVLLVILLIDTTGLYQYSFLKQLENWTYDARINFTLPNTVDKRIVIVDIDEDSLATVGRWPWSRNHLATIIDNLFDEYKVKSLGFDIVFAEKDNSSGLHKFEELAANQLKNNSGYKKVLNDIRDDLQYDSIFANSLKNKNITMGYYFKTQFENDENDSSGAIPPSLAKLDKDITERLPVNKATGYGGNLEELQTAAKTGGYFDNPYVSNDGVFRRVPLIQFYNQELFPSLALSLANISLGNPQVTLSVETDGKKSGSDYYALESIDMGEYKIPVDINGAIYVPYRGKAHSFPYVSAADVLNKKADPEVLKDAIVLFGTSAPGLLDLRSTPVQNVYPGVEVHANIVSGILDQNINHKPAWTLGYEFLLLIFIGGIMALILPILSPLFAAFFTFGILFSIVLGSFIAWNSNLILPMASPLLLTSLVFILHMTYGFFIESRGKRQLAGIFGQYIPPELVDEMSESPAEFSLEGESKEMTVLFSDVRGFTTLSEGLDPHELTQLMNALLTPMTRVIHNNRGTIDKYMGDCIMAFWGAPLDDPEHARNSLYAALDMMKELKIMQAEFKERGWPPVNVGIGLNTGEMNVGNMGSEFRMAYTVLGDTVNLGSRLEGLTKAYGVDIIVGELTKKQIPEFIFRELDLVRVKGKNEPVAIFEPIGHKNDISKDLHSELVRYKQALKAFRMQKWDNAEVDFFSLNRAHPDHKLFQEYLNRIQKYRLNPPPDDWDGVFTHTSK
ncbi:MAG: adenylate/guanylate cyclase domain-containing protein [Gammaproteobacteria bacterium]|nr:adenylate/guanylate cyclase domain-containing protein [Gammaproteobacteria bacterium]